MAERSLSQIENANIRFLPQDIAAKPTAVRILPNLSDYLVTLEAMEQNVAAIADGNAVESLWLLEHPPLYTAGTSADASDLLTPQRFPVFETGRGGQYTYHGPGQAVGYVMLDLKQRAQDVRAFIFALEAWLIASLAECGVTGERRADRVGVWVVRHDKPLLADGTFPEDKIAAIGIRLRKWVSFHGVALNVAPNLEHFSGIVPCGVQDHGVTSLDDLGIKASMTDVQKIMAKQFEMIFGPIQTP